MENQKTQNKDPEENKVEEIKETEIKEITEKKKGKYIWVILFPIAVVILSMGINWVSSNIEDKQYVDLEIIKVPGYCEYYCLDERINETRGIADGETSNLGYFIKEGCSIQNCTEQEVYRVINRKSYYGREGQDEVCGAIFTEYPQIEILPGRVLQSS